MNEKKSSDYPGLQVIGAGLPRTATTSLHRSLELLGYAPCHTFKNYIIDEWAPYTHSRLWQRACNLPNNKAQRQKLIHELYQSTGCLAAVDAPTAMFIDDLIEMYPNAKVVLGVRSSPGAWRKSFNATIGKVMSPWFNLATFLFPHQRFALQPTLTALNDMSRRRYGAAWTDWESTECYTRHNEWVRSVVSKERLLEFEPKMGFGVLCEFLGVEVPKDGEGMERGFPRENEGPGFEKALVVFEWVGWASWGLVVAGGYGVARWWGFI